MKGIFNQAVWAVLFKLCTALFLFLISGLLYRYYSLYDYGRWAFSFGLLPLFLFFDFGVGYWLQNQFCRKNFSITNRHFTYGVVVLFLLGVIFSFIVCGIYYVFFEDYIEVLFVVIFCCFSGVINIGDRVYASVSKNQVIELQQAIIYSVFFIVLFILTYFFEYIRIQLLILFFILLYITVKLLFLFLLFSSNIVRFSALNLKSLKKFFVLSLYRGRSFFAAQVTSIMFYNIDRLMITFLLGVSVFAVYEPVYRYFSLVITLSMVVLRPFWAELAKSDSKDVRTIKTVIRTSFMYCGVLTAFVFVMALVSPVILEYWLGHNFVFDLKVVAYTSIYVVCCIFIVLACYLTNGLRLQKIQFSTFIFGTSIKLIGVTCLYVYGAISLSNTLLISIFSAIMSVVYILKRSKILND
ncbi:hypothetical protein [Shewanella algae]|uniref:lipopolysaccharide biosynthesis protein n=1 Tax=Shewanella algae TaxID=38313 RepID=UPI0031F521A9